MISKKLSGFIGIVKYELLWNRRKRKLSILLAITFSMTLIIGLILPLFSSVTSGSLYWQRVLTLLTNDLASGIFIVLIGIFLTMESISHEFEVGTISSLLVQPVSRKTVYFGKLFASFITVLAVSALLVGLSVLFTSLALGVQTQLWLTLPAFLMLVVSMFFYSAIAFMFSSLVRNTSIAGISSLVFFIVMSIVTAIVTLSQGFQQWLMFLPVTSISTLTTFTLPFFNDPTGSSRVGVNIGASSGSGILSYSNYVGFTASIVSTIAFTLAFIIVGYIRFRSIEVKETRGS